jgi:undecaprenyl-diphosphatase
MDIFTAIILGLVQGITEFFPVSSSAHLRLAKWLLGVPDGEHLLYFDLLCHSGTLIALILYLRRSIWEILCKPRAIALFIVALLPLVPAYFLLKPLRVAASEPRFLGWALLATSAILFCAGRVNTVPMKSRKWRDVLCIGAAQTMALIPGVSRSGSTIAMARWLGWDWVEAARFSFLLAIPAVLGGQLLETLKLLRGGEMLYGLPWEVYAAGFATSFGVGLFSVRFVFWAYERGTVNPFAWYCLGVGLFAIWNFYG